MQILNPQSSTLTPDSWLLAPPLKIQLQTQRILEITAPHKNGSFPAFRESKIGSVIHAAFEYFGEALIIFKIRGQKRGDS